MVLSPTTLHGDGGKFRHVKKVTTLIDLPSFYINLPIGAVVIVAVAIFLRLPIRNTDHNTSWKSIIRQLDLPGAFIFLPSIVCLLLALQWGGTKYSWSNGRIIALLVLFGVLLLAFILVQKIQKENATVPLYILRQRSVACGNFFLFLLSGSYFIIIYYLPIWFQAVKEVSAVKSGIMCLPTMLGVVIFSLLTGGAVASLGVYVPFFYVSAILSPIGAGLLTTLTVNSGSSKWIGYQIIFGIGTGFGIQLTMIAVQSIVALADVPVATAIVSFCQLLGGAVFISVGQNVFSNELQNGLIDRGINASSSLLQNVGATQLVNFFGPEEQGLVKVIYNDALTKTWYIPTALSALSMVGAVGMEWKSIKSKLPAAVSEA